MTIKEDEALKQWLEEQLKIGLMVKLSSRYAVLYFYIPKKGRSLQLVQDYRKLNQYTIKDKTLLPCSSVKCLWLSHFYIGPCVRPRNYCPYYCSYYY